ATVYRVFAVVVGIRNRAVKPDTGALTSGVQRDAGAVDDDAPDATDDAEPEVATAELRPIQNRPIHGAVLDAVPRNLDAPGLRGGRAGEAIELDRAFLCDVAEHEAPHDDRGDGAAGDAAIGRCVAD